jgi:tRNA (Thr-GGU) A37 N-methylase
MIGLKPQLCSWPYQAQQYVNKLTMIKKKNLNVQLRKEFNKALTKWQKCKELIVWKRINRSERRFKCKKKSMHACMW